MAVKLDEYLKAIEGVRQIYGDTGVLSIIRQLATQVCELASRVPETHVLKEQVEAVTRTMRLIDGRVTACADRLEFNIGRVAAVSAHAHDLRSTIDALALRVNGAERDDEGQEKVNVDFSDRLRRVEKHLCLDTLATYEACGQVVSSPLSADSFIPGKVTYSISGTFDRPLPKWKSVVVYRSKNAWIVRDHQDFVDVHQMYSFDTMEEVGNFVHAVLTQEHKP